MKGVILGFDAATLRGAIRSEDGTRYEFSTAEWRTPGVPPRPGMQVDFEPSNGQAVAIYSASGGGGVAPDGDSISLGGGGGDFGRLFLARPAILAGILMLIGCLMPYAGALPDNLFSVMSNGVNPMITQIQASKTAGDAEVQRAQQSADEMLNNINQQVAANPEWARQAGPQIEQQKAQIQSNLAEVRARVGRETPNVFPFYAYYLLWGIPVVALIVLWLEWARRDAGGSPAILRLVAGGIGVGCIILLPILVPMFANYRPLALVPGFGNFNPAVGGFVILGGSVIMLLNSLGVIRSFTGR